MGDLKEVKFEVTVLRLTERSFKQDTMQKLVGASVTGQLPAACVGLSKADWQWPW